LRKAFEEQLGPVVQADSPIPVLWHYTQHESLLKIVEAQKIWATHYQFLNDEEEMLLRRA
jgi:hypothetical protein